MNARNNNGLRDWIGEAMKSKGFHDGWRADDWRGGALVRVALCQTEVCEAMQEVKRYWGKEGVSQPLVKKRVAEEAADTAIRLYDLAYLLDIDLNGDDRTIESGLPFGGDDRDHLIMRCGELTCVIGSLFVEIEECDRPTPMSFLIALNRLDNLCEDVGEKFCDAISEKMTANMKRPYRYGTPDEGKQPV